MKIVLLEIITSVSSILAIVVLLIQIPPLMYPTLLALFGYTLVGLITHLVTKKRSVPKLTVASLVIHLIAITSLILRYAVFSSLSFDVRRYEPFINISLILLACTVIVDAVTIKHDKSFKYLLVTLAVYLIVFAIIFPNSFIIYLLGLITLVFATELHDKKRSSPLLLLSLLSFALLLIGIGRIIYSDIIVNRSLKMNDLFQRRQMQYQALSLNSGSEKNHILFANTNILIAHKLGLNQDPIALIANRGGLTNQDRLTTAMAVEAAIAEGQKLVIINPQNPNNWFHLGKIYQSVQTFVQEADRWAIASFQKASELDPRNENYYFEIGKTYYNTGEFQKGLTYFEKALTLNPRYQEALYYLGWSHYRLQNLPKAIDSIRKALPYGDSKHILSQFEKQLRK